MTDSALALVLAGISVDSEAPTIKDWRRFEYYSDFGYYEHVAYLPPSLVHALSNLVKPLLASRQWYPPTNVVRAVKALCRSGHVSRPHPSPTVEDLRVFLDWVETAVMEALLDG